MVDGPFEAEKEETRLGSVLVDKLAKVSPTVEAMLQEHQEDYGETLATLFLGDLAQWYVEAWLNRHSDRTAFLEAQRVVDELSRRFVDGPEPVQNTIGVGFLEMLPYRGQEGRDCVAELPEPLRAELARMESWSPST